MSTTFASTYLRLHIALPAEHGAWVFILSPLLIGLFAGGRWTAASAYLVLAAMAAFLIRQPLTVAIKAYSGRRSRRDLPAARFWMLIYAMVGLLALAGLVSTGFAYLLVLALPGVPVFAWHLYLVSKRLERRQVGVEVVGSGVLALAAPAGLWVGIGSPDPLGWWLFILTWLQSAASIVYAYLRLEQRELESMPDPTTRWRMGRRAILYTSFNLAFSILVTLPGWLPVLLPLPFALQWLETLWGASHPAIGFKPIRIGLRQLAISSLFTLLFILTWSFSR